MVPNRLKYFGNVVLVFMGSFLVLTVAGLALPVGATASGLELGRTQETGEMVGITSEPLPCLAVGEGQSGSATGTVKLAWQGQVVRARLILDIAGTEALHHIHINGQPVVEVPVQSGGEPCGHGEVSYLAVPPEVLIQGDNLIEITSDAQPGDSWTASNVRLEVLGFISRGSPGPQEVGRADVSASAIATTHLFTNAYDGSLQEFRAQVPGSYNPGVPAPLLIAVHPRSGTMYWGEDKYGAATEAMGWLLASPELHGHWEVPAECLTYPNSCQYEDQVVAGTRNASDEPRPGAFAYASLESQYDIIGALQYMIDHYNVDPARIYLVGYSMGAQGGIITAAKFPHVFAAVFANMGPTDMDIWHDEQVSFYGTANAHVVRAMRKECYVGVNTPAYPGPPDSPTNPFCYQRRSGLNFASNYIHLPISLTHSTLDALVPAHHSRDLRDKINSFNPDHPVSLFEDTIQGPTCPDTYHCYEPDPTAVLNFLEQYTLNNTPSSINIMTDESKTYYWLKITQTGDEHWTQVRVSYNPTLQRVTAHISDTRPLTLSFNLGTVPTVDIISQPGMGLPSGLYKVTGGGNDYITSYSSGYLKVTSEVTGQYTVNIQPEGEIIYETYVPLILK